MSFEKRFVDSTIVMIKFRSPEWDDLIKQNPVYQNEPVDVIQLFRCQQNFWLCEFIYLKQLVAQLSATNDESEEELKQIPMSNISKKDWRLIDTEQPMKIYTKRDKKILENRAINKLPISPIGDNGVPPNIQIEYI